MERVWDPLRRKEVALTPEESVRQWFISVLKDEAGVPLHMMRSEVSMDYGGKTSRADIVVYRRDLSPAMIVECKRPSVALSPKVLDQALRYHSLMDAGWLVVTNGPDTRIFRRTEGQFAAVSFLPSYNDIQ